ncbi:hypothetical protein L7F22_002826 [Adiantum nelumboides]|nr:hypothetical protein [Adiantum nelumboides]
MAGRGRLPPPLMAGRGPIPGPEALRMGPGMSVLPPGLIMEEKIATQHQEIQRLLTENQRLAATHVALRQELAATQQEVQRLQQALRNGQAEKEAQFRGIAEKSTRMEQELRALEPLKLDLQRAQADAQKLLLNRQELSGQVQQLTQDMQRVRADAQQVPAMKAEIDGLRQEIQRARTAFEFEKNANAELLEQRTAMEKNLVSMAREVEKLRAELTNAEKKVRGGGYGGSYGTEGGYGAYGDGYGVSQLNSGPPMHAAEYTQVAEVDLKVHLLVHLVDEVEIAGTVHARWMFFLERFMKTLKRFVRQRARPEGSMAEGWMVQESCVFISEYLTRSQNNIIELWNIKDDERVVSEVPQGNGVVKRFSEAERIKVSDYCMMNTDIMQRWYEMYEQMRQQQIRAREEWRHTSKSVSYPDDTSSSKKLHSILRDQIRGGGMLFKLPPRSRHIFDERGVEEFLPGEAMEEDHQTDEEHRTIAPPRELCIATDETSSDDSSNEGDNDLSNGNDDDPFNSLDMNDMVPAQSVTSTSLGINLELVLDLSQEDVCIDEISAPYDE